MGNLPHLPAVNVASFAGSQVQPVLEALPVVAPTPSPKEIGFAAAHAAVLQAKAATQVSRPANCTDHALSMSKTETCTFCRISTWT